MDNRTERAYTGWPERIYVVDREGTIAYKSGPGPFGFSSDELASVLERMERHASSIGLQRHGTQAREAGESM